MTEADWLAATDPGLVWLLWDKASERKLQLYAVACARRLWDQFPEDDCRRLVVGVEHLADAPDNDAVHSDSEALYSALHAGYERVHQSDTRRRGTYLTALVCGSALHDAQRAAEDASSTTAIALVGDTQGPEWEAERLAHTALMQCIFGNPFRPVAFDPRWRTETAVTLASGTYADRAFDRLPILADALEDAGCDAANLLAHLRGPGPHARGCWPLDLVLGKS